MRYAYAIVLVVMLAQVSAAQFVFEDAKLTANDGAAGDSFGRSVAISNDLAVVGARDHSHEVFKAGAAYVFRFDSTSGLWNQEVELRTPIGAFQRDYFGSSVSISPAGDRILVGAPQESFQDQPPGFAIMFRYDSGSETWEYEARLQGSQPGVLHDFFGNAVSLNENYAAVGAPSGNGAAGGTGVVYLFRKEDLGDTVTWVEEAQVHSSTVDFFVAFGNSTELTEGPDGVRLLASQFQGKFGEHPGVFVFRREQDETWIQEDSLSSSGGSLTCCEPPGTIDGTRAVANAREFFEAGLFVFEREADSWELSQVVIPSDPEHAEFGFGAAAVRGDLLLGGQSVNDVHDSFAGVAHLFQRNAQGFWTDVALLCASDAEDHDSFGDELALSDQHALIGARSGGDVDQGAAYVFNLATLVAEETQIPEMAEPGISVWPNPAHTSVAARFELSQASHVRISLVDMLGRVLRVVHDGQLGPGRHALSFSVSTMPPGNYLLRCTIGGSTYARIITVL